MPGRGPFCSASGSACNGDRKTVLRNQQAFKFYQPETPAGVRLWSRTIPVGCTVTFKLMLSTRARGWFLKPLALACHCRHRHRHASGDSAEACPAGERPGSRSLPTRPAGHAAGVHLAAAPMQARLTAPLQCAASLRLQEAAPGSASAGFRPGSGPGAAPAPRPAPVPMVTPGPRPARGLHCRITVTDTGIFVFVSFFKKNISNSGRLN